MNEKVATPITSDSSQSQPAPQVQNVQTPVVQSVLETQVQEQVAQPKDITLPESDDPIKPGPDVDTLIPTDNYRHDPLFYEVVNYLGIKENEYDTVKNKISEIVDYVIRAKGSNDPAEILTGIRQIEDRIQPPTFGERRFSNVHRYVRLAGKKQAISQAMSAFEKAGHPDGQLTR